MDIKVTNKIGIGFYISGHIMDNLLDFEPVTGGICKIKVILKYYNLAVISIHIPTEEKKMKEQKKNFIVLWRRYVMQFPIMT